MPYLKNTSLEEKGLLTLFDLGVIIKGLDGLVQAVAGLALWLAGPQAVLRLAAAITARELAEDPRDLIANYIVRLGHAPVHSEAIIAAYLLLHGIAKMIIAASLLRGRLWAYPAAIAVFGAFAAYQIIVYGQTRSWWILALTIVDILVVALTWHEYRLARRKNAA